MSHLLITEKNILECSLLSSIDEQSGLYLLDPIIDADNLGNGTILVEDNSALVPAT